MLGSFPSGPHARADAVLRDLGLGATVDAQVCIVVAHPDDETLGLGLRLADFARLTLIHITDGAPASLGPTRRLHAIVRRRELDTALARLGACPTRISLDVPDQEAALDLAGLARRLAEPLAGADVVITHAYEGGHPDHDAAAFAVRAACADLPHPPDRLEFAGYHQTDAGRRTGCFWPAAPIAAVRPLIEAPRLAAKRQALAAFESQASVLAWFDPRREAYRRAPAYDFTEPPPPGRALYDDWGWSLTGEAWRDHAARALRDLGLAEAA